MNETQLVALMERRGDAVEVPPIPPLHARGLARRRRVIMIAAAAIAVASGVVVAFAPENGSDLAGDANPTRSISPLQGTWSLEPEPSQPDDPPVTIRFSSGTWYAYDDCESGKGTFNLSVDMTFTAMTDEIGGCGAIRSTGIAFVLILEATRMVEKDADGYSLLNAKGRMIGTLAPLP